MSSEGGRGRAVALVPLLLGLCGLGLCLWQLRAGPTAGSGLDAATGPLKTRAEAALANVAKPVERVASEAARVPQLAAAFDNGVDGATFKDAFETEEWWRRFRSDGRKSALATRDKLIVNLFPADARPALEALAEQARTHGLARGVLRAGNMAYCVAAARIEGPEVAETSGAVVVVGEPFDQPTLAAAAAPTGLALCLSDGQKVLVAAGPPQTAPLFARLAGQEAAGARVTEAGFPAAVSQLSAGLWLWAVGTTPLAAGTRTTLLRTGLGLSLAFVLVGFVWLLKRRSASPLATGSKVSTQSGRPAPQAPFANEPESGSSTGVQTNPGTPSARHAAVAPTQAMAVGGAAVAPAPAIGPQVLGRYTLLDKIGEGGMAEIFRAKLFGAEGFERLLVVKRLRPEMTGYPAAVSQFIDEARLQSELVHSNIVPVFDFGRAGDDFYLALEHIAGRDLEKVLLRHVALHGTGLPLPLIGFVMHEVLTALEFAHTRRDREGKPLDIVHRDVSLGNVLVSYQGEVKLSDFGIAKGEHRVSQTQIGMVKGNTGFMAPEQARGEPVDPRADVFAAGAVMFCCLSGRGLYDTEGNASSQLLRASVGPGTQQLEVLKQFPAGIAQIVARAIAPDPRNRFASAGVFLAALRPWVTARREDLGQLMRALFAEELQRPD